jgi:hypothetical protein
VCTVMSSVVTQLVVCLPVVQAIRGQGFSISYLFFLISLFSWHHVYNSFRGHNVYFIVFDFFLLPLIFHI